MQKAKVSIVRLKDYKKDNVYRALKESLDLLDSLENIIKPNSKVFVKINHLSPPSPPEKAIVTHPAFTREVLRLLKQYDLKITVGDDIQSKEKDGFAISGYRKICKELDIPLVNLRKYGFQEVLCQGRILEKIYISPLLLEADFILNLPKLKTHSFSIFTGAIKNMYGIIPYGFRLKYHHQYPRTEIFSKMLVDIFSCAPPHLNIMDAVVAMEGEGPGAGDPINVGLVIASKDGVALDAVASKIAGFNPMDIYTTLDAHQRKLGIGDIEKIYIAGEKIRDVEVRNFKHSAIAVGFLRRKIPSFLYAFIQDQLTLIPEIIRDKCTGCMECVDICSTNAARGDQDKAWIDKSLCIHCMCCHEVCRFQAIKLKQKLIGRMIRGYQSISRRFRYLVSEN